MVAGSKSSIYSAKSQVTHYLKGEKGRRRLANDSSRCFYPLFPGCDSKIVTGKTDSAICLGMQRRRNRRKVEIYTCVGKGRHRRTNMRCRIFHEACTRRSLTWRGYYSAKKKTQFTFMVVAVDGAYLQQHTRNSAALERKGSCFWPRRRRRRTAT